MKKSTAWSLAQQQRVNKRVSCDNPNRANGRLGDVTKSGIIGSFLPENSYEGHFDLLNRRYL